MSSAWVYVLARSLAGLPTSIQDSLVYGKIPKFKCEFSHVKSAMSIFNPVLLHLYIGSFVYWMAGFTFSASNYFVFLLLTLLSAFTCGLMFSIFRCVQFSTLHLIIFFLSNSSRSWFYSVLPLRIGLPHKLVCLSPLLSWCSLAGSRLLLA